MNAPISNERLAELIAGHERFKASGDTDWPMSTDDEDYAIYCELVSLRAEFERLRAPMAGAIKLLGQLRNIPYSRDDMTLAIDAWLAANSPPIADDGGDNG